MSVRRDFSYDSTNSIRAIRVFNPSFSSCLSGKGDQIRSKTYWLDDIAYLILSIWSESTEIEGDLQVDYGFDCISSTLNRFCHSCTVSFRLSFSSYVTFTTRFRCSTSQALSLRPLISASFASLPLLSSWMFSNNTYMRFSSSSTLVLSWTWTILSTICTGATASTNSFYDSIDCCCYCCCYGCCYGCCYYKWFCYCCCWCKDGGSTTHARVWFLNTCTPWLASYCTEF